MDIAAENRKTANINGIDLVKFICSLLVAAIHIYPFRDFPPEGGTPLNFFLQSYLARVAVPFFFICTGFFLFGKAGLTPPRGKSVLHTCLRLLWMYLIWRLLFPASYRHLWYLTAAAAASALVYLCAKLGMKLPQLCILALALYLIGVSGDAYRGLTRPLEHTALLGPLIRGYREVFRYTRNGLFMGFPFVLTGAVLAIHPVRLSRRVNVMGLCAVMAGLFAEAALLHHFQIPADSNMYLLLPPAAVLLFCLARDLKLPDGPLWPRLRKLSVLVYCLHMPVFTGLRALGGPGLNPWLFPLTLLCSLALGQLLLTLSRFRWLRWLRLLYS